MPSENRPPAAPPGRKSAPARRWLAPLFRRYIDLAARFPGLLLLLFLGLAGLCVVPITQLELHTDLAELLPDDHPAVQALRRVGPRQISSTNLVVILESPDVAANRRFAEALRPELTRLIGSVFSEIQWRPDTEVPDYARKWQWLYASLEDLSSAENLLDRLIARRTSPLMVDIEGDAEAELKALRQKLNQQLPPRNDGTYFEFQPGPEHRDYPDKSIHYLGIMLWRRGDGLATSGDQQTLNLVEQLVGRMQPSQFHPQMRVEYSGGIAMAIDEHNAVREDLTKATAVCVLLVLLAIYLYFRRVAVLAVIGAPAILGVLVALAAARYTIHHLNANTAFLISIILGNGINSPIILLARYGEERRAGQPVKAALLTAMNETLLATVTATLAASISYACLLATSLRGFNQFGLVGGVGMVAAWSLTFLVVPPLVLLGERLRPGILTPKPTLWRGPFALLGRLAERQPLLLLLVSLALVAAAAVPALRYARDPIEYNFDNLRTDNPATAHRWDIMYNLGLGNLGAGYIARDGVILVDTPAQADVVADALLAKDRALGDKSVIEAVRTLHKVLPDKQDEKLALLARVRQKLDKHHSLMDEDEWKDLQPWRPPDTLRKLTVPDLPRRLRENFTEVDGTVGRFVGIDADPHRYGEGNGRELIRLSHSLQVTVLGKTWVAAAASTVFAGMLEVIVQDGPKVTLYALIGVSLLILVAFGLRGAPLVLTAIGIGLLWLAGLLGVFQWKLNFLNFVALPITLGVGADYAANIWARIRAEGTTNIGHIVADTGSAVALCSTTTIIGYSSLLLASNRALQSFGRLADLGEITCLLAALLALPALTLLIVGKREPEKAR
jgi:predicted RND superfamily exporter protein